MDFSSRVALIVGVAQYDYVTPLKYSARDAGDFCSILERRLHFDKDKLFLLSDESETKPTRGNFFHCLNTVCDRLEANDLLIFYFSGHGIFDRGKDYLLLNDTTHLAIPETAILVDTIADKLYKSACKRVVLFIDACREAISGAKGAVSLGDEARSALDREGMATYFSCDPSDRSYEVDKLGHGIFTHCLLEMIETQSRPLTINDVNEHLRMTVPRISKAHDKPVQQPFLVLNPVDIGDLVLFEPLTKEGLPEVALYLDRLPDLFEANIEAKVVIHDLEIKFDELLFQKLVEVLLRVRDGDVREFDAKKLQAIKTLCGGGSVEAFLHTWVLVERLARSRRQPLGPQRPER